MNRFCRCAVTGILCMLLLTTVSAQELQKPSEGKALVYFMRTSGTGALINFKYFDGEKFLGKFSGRNYLVYECEPGEHLFWVTAENRFFVNATLLPGKTYVIEALPLMGMMKARVELIPLQTDDEKAHKRITKLLKVRNEPVLIDEEEVRKEQEELAYYIKSGLERYDKLAEKEDESYSVVELTEDMFHDKIIMP